MHDIQRARAGSASLGRDGRGVSVEACSFRHKYGNAVTSSHGPADVDESRDEARARSRPLANQGSRGAPSTSRNSNSSGACMPDVAVRSAAWPLLGSHFLSSTPPLRCC